MRGSCGSPKIWLGGPSSRITPASRKQILFATSRAKFISCVAMIIVMPTSLRSRTSWSTSLTSCGSSALVISSSSISFGSMASARTIATRCCCPPESRSGNSCAFSRRPMRSSSSYARASASFFDSPRDLRGESVTFCSTVMCGKRLKAWKTMPICWRSLLTSILPLGQVLAVERDRRRRRPSRAG